MREEFRNALDGKSTCETAVDGKIITADCNASGVPILPFSLHLKFVNNFQNNT
jgi:hypothetical protein